MGVLRDTSWVSWALLMQGESACRLGGWQALLSDIRCLKRCIVTFPVLGPAKGASSGGASAVIAEVYAAQFEKAWPVSLDSKILPVITTPFQVLIKRALFPFAISRHAYATGKKVQGVLGSVQAPCTVGCCDQLRFVPGSMQGLRALRPCFEGGSQQLTDAHFCKQRMHRCQCSPPALLQLHIPPPALHHSTCDAQLQLYRVLVGQE